MAGTRRWGDRLQWGGHQTWGGADVPTPTPTDNDYSYNDVGWCVSFVPDAEWKIDAILDRIAATGATLVRTDAYWSGLQPTNPGSAPAGQNDTFKAEELALYDYYLDGCAERGLKWLVMFGYTPTWARPGLVLPPGVTGDKVPPQRELAHDAPDYANFVWWLVDHFEQRQPGVLYGVEVWNEPNLGNATFGFWHQPPSTALWPGASWSPDPLRYAEMCRGVWNALKNGEVYGRADRTPYPDVPILVGGSAAGTTTVAGNVRAVDFNRAMWEHTGAEFFDHVTYHPYQWRWAITKEDSWNHAMNAHREMWPLMKEFGRSDARIWATEFGMPTRPDASGFDPASRSDRKGGWGIIPDAEDYPGQWRTDPDAISYSDARSAAQDYYAFWRGALHYDAEILDSFAGPMLWYNLNDTSSDIYSDWGTKGREPYFGACEWGTNGYDGPAKPHLIDIFNGLLPDTEAPTCSIFTPSAGAAYGALTDDGFLMPVGVAAIDNRDGIVRKVAIYIDGALVTYATPSGFGYAASIDTQSLADGAHTLRALALDAAGNQTWSETVPFSVTNTPSIVEPPGTEIVPHSDWRLYVRNANYARIGVVSTPVKLEATLRVNDVDSWSLTLDWSDVSTAALLEPGAGIQLMHRDGVVLSGPVTDYEHVWQGDADLLTVSGVSDEIHLADRLALQAPFEPDIANGASAIFSEHFDVISGDAGDVLAAYVNRNAGPAAIAAREVPLLSIDSPTPGTGSVITGKARMQNLLDFLRSLAAAGNVLFEVKATTSGPVFRCYEPVDRRASIKFSAALGNIERYSYRVGRPTMTDAYVGDGGKGPARKFMRVATASTGSRIEGFVDAASANSPAELQQQGVAQLSESGAEQSAEITIIDTANQQFMADYQLGDIVSVVIDGQTIVDMVRSVKLVIDENGLVAQPEIATVPRVALALLRSQRALKQRVDGLETQ